LHKIDYIEGEAGVFFLLDVRSHGIATFKDEQDLLVRMVDYGVYIAPGFSFYTNEPGFFRLTFALPWPILENGLKQFVKALDHHS
jgi:1-aminocyclopropane-1-carboxylate synthase